MIEINNISKSFRDKKVLFKISGKFEKGKTNLIIGSSGTGKSVLLKCLVGLLKPDKGSVLFDGRDFTNANKNLTTEIRREIGMLFQGSALFDSKNVEENVKFPLDILTNTPEKEKIDKVNHCLKLVGLEKINHKMPSELSGGMKKRVGIARAIVNDSKYLFCDEPNSGLDPVTAIKIDDLILEHKNVKSIKKFFPSYSSKIVLKDTEINFNQTKNLNLLGLIKFDKKFENFSLQYLPLANKNLKLMQKLVCMIYL